MEGEKGTIEFVGNRTECALLVMLQKWGEDYRAIRDLNHDKVGAWMPGYLLGGRMRVGGRVGGRAGGRAGEQGGRQEAEWLHPRKCDDFIR